MFAFLNHLLRKKWDSWKSSLFLHLEIDLSSSSEMPGEKLECGEFRGFLVLQFLAHNVGIHVFSRHVTEHGLTICTLIRAKTASLNAASQPLSIRPWIRCTRADLSQSTYDAHCNPCSYTLWWLSIISNNICNPYCGLQGPLHLSSHPLDLWPTHLQLPWLRVPFTQSACNSCQMYYRIA